MIYAGALGGGLLSYHLGLGWGVILLSAWLGGWIGHTSIYNRLALRYGWTPLTKGTPGSRSQGRIRDYATELSHTQKLDLNNSYEAILGTLDRAGIVISNHEAREILAIAAKEYLNNALDARPDKSEDEEAAFGVAIREGGYSFDDKFFDSI